MMEKIEKELQDTWTEKHRNSGLLGESYKRLGYATLGQRVFFCATDLEFKTPIDGSADPKLHRANFCKDRLCNMCAWRRSRKIFGQVSQVMDHMGNEYAYLFVTYTIRNCSAKELTKTIDTLLSGYNQLSKKTVIKKAFKGSFRTLEITRNPDLPQNLEYHPHLHVIYAVNKSYFKNSTYIKNKDLAEMWQNCIKADYYPQVDMQRVTPEKSKKAKTIKGAVAEVAKYSIKASDILIGDEHQVDRTVFTLMHALANRRLCSFSGIMKKTAHDLKLDDLTEGDLVNTDNQKMRQDVAYIITTYKWSIGYGYYLHDTREATNDDL